MSFTPTLIAFLRRDFLLETSYRFAMALRVLGILAHLVTFYFIGRIFAAEGSPWLEPYGGSYFPFVLIGIVFSGFMGLGLLGFSSSIRTEQTWGTLETLLTSPLPVHRIALVTTFSGMAVVAVEALVYIGAGSLLGADFPRAAWGTAALALGLSVAACSAFGVLAGSFILYFKRGDPVNWAFGLLSEFLGGVYFPVALLPSWLQAVSSCLPMTHGLEALRGALINGAAPADVAGPLIFLLAFAAIGWPLALAALRVSLDAVRRQGTLGHY